MSMRVVVPFEPSPIDVAFVAPMSRSPAPFVSRPVVAATVISPLEATSKFAALISSPQPVPIAMAVSVRFA